ncbi:MAG: TonB-dependent receptor plug domain-containing protein [Verrucomicrobiaceae bacterium]|nr:TonB-dependent receptor plug domain-containing protein [Verrucomicrobiaceae bacterium]
MSHFRLLILLTCLSPIFPSSAQNVQELEETIIEGKAEELLQKAASASKGQTSSKELMERPFSRRGELLESVPGMIVTQHSGDGKANQYFLRGTNLDHGTDFGMYLDGMPINLRTHAHGQGYSDLNFIIPELVGELEYWKGNYYAPLGDLSSTGAARFKLVDALPQGILSSTFGAYDYTRTLVADSIQAGAGTLTVALEHQYYNGPWDLSSDATRWNGFARWHWENGRDKFNVTLMGYHGEWMSTDQVPQRAIDSGLIGRYGFIDPTNGGNSQRYSLSADWERVEGRVTTKANAYVGYYDLDLFSNFSYFTAGPGGDQFEQVESRWFAGAAASRDWRWDALGHEQRFSAGVNMHHDFISGIGLHQTTARQRTATVREDDIYQATYGLWSELEFKPTDWLRVIPGLRADFFHFNTRHSTLQENNGSLTKGLMSPKLAVIFGPWQKTELYLNAGMGFHSNDTRGVTLATDPATLLPTDRVDPLPRSYGAEFGIRNESIRHMVNTLSFWWLRSDSELIYVGDAGSSTAGPGSERFGVELSSYWRPTDWAMVDAEATWTAAALRGAATPSASIPGNVPVTLNAGFTLGKAEGFFGSLRARFFSPRPLTEDFADIRARESLQVNARVGYRRKNWEVSLDCLNLLNRQDNDIEYYYDSQLPTEAVPASDHHVHPVEPRMLRVSMTWRW